VLQTACHRSINLGRGLVDLQTSQLKGCLTFQLQDCVFDKLKSTHLAEL